jgi:hypothetical protein
MVKHAARLWIIATTPRVGHGARHDLGSKRGCDNTENNPSSARCESVSVRAMKLALHWHVEGTAGEGCVHQFFGGPGRRDVDGMVRTLREHNASKSFTRCERVNVAGSPAVKMVRVCMMSRICVALVVVRRQRQNIEKPGHPVVRRTIARGGTMPAIMLDHEITRKPATGTPGKTLAGHSRLYTPEESTCMIPRKRAACVRTSFMVLEISKWR